jgi:tRNA U34 2-thiouridine synthase MnmA/TrmU
VQLTDLRWISWKPEEGEKTPFECRTRALGQRVSGTLSSRRKTGTFTFAEPQSPQAPGQCLVLYRGEEVVGGGVVWERSEEAALH